MLSLITCHVVPALGTRTPSSVKISRQDYELNSFPEKLLTVSNNEGMFLIEEEERKNKKNTTSQNENKLKNENLNFKKEYSLRDCVLSSSSMVMWGYPTPPNTTSFTTSIPISNPTLSLSISSSSLSTSFTTVSLNSGTVPEESSLPSLPLSSSSLLGRVPNSVDKRIREEDSSVFNDDVISKKMRKEDSLEISQEEDSLETSNESCQGRFFGSSNVDEKEIMKEHQNPEIPIKEMSNAANDYDDDNDNNDNNDNSNNDNDNDNDVNNGNDVNNDNDNNNENNNVHNDDNKSNDENSSNSNKNNCNNKSENSDVINKNEDKDKEDVGISLKQSDEQDKTEQQNNTTLTTHKTLDDVTDEPAVGSRVGSVPTFKEAKEIFNTRIVVENDNNTCKNENENGEVNENEYKNENEKQKDAVTDNDVPSLLVFPSYTVSMQMTRGGPNSSPGVSVFRSTVSQASKNFKLLWTTSAACTASARTLFFLCCNTYLLCSCFICFYLHLHIV